MTGEESDTQDTSEDEVTVWAPEPTGSDEILDIGAVSYTHLTLPTT